MVTPLQTQRPPHRRVTPIAAQVLQARSARGLYGHRLRTGQARRPRVPVPQPGAAGIRSSSIAYHSSTSSLRHFSSSISGAGPSLTIRRTDATTAAAAFCTSSCGFGPGFPSYRDEQRQRCEFPPPRSTRQLPDDSTVQHSLADRMRRRSLMRPPHRRMHPDARPSCPPTRRRPRRRAVKNKRREEHRIARL
jgi:hypothetical protein